MMCLALLVVGCELWGIILERIMVSTMRLRYCHLDGYLMVSAINLMVSTMSYDGFYHADFLFNWKLST